MLAEWIDAGYIFDFKWPVDDEDKWLSAADYWRPENHYGVRKMAGIGDEPTHIDEAVDGVRRDNHGVAIDAFLEYWKSTPRRNANEIYQTYVRFYESTRWVGGALVAYKLYALESLKALKEALDENESRASWFPWVGPSDDEIYIAAGNLAREFDYKIMQRGEKLQDDLGQELGEVLSKKGILQQIAKPDTEGLGFGD